MEKVNTIPEFYIFGLILVWNFSLNKFFILFYLFLLGGKGGEGGRGGKDKEQRTNVKSKWLSFIEEANLKLSTPNFGI